VPHTDGAILRTALERAHDMLARLEPAWQPTLDRLARRLRPAHAALACEPAATLHGDLHPGNLLVDDGRLAFIDFDAVHTGAAVFELGAWIACTLGRAVLDGTPMQHAEPACRAFLAAYADASGRAVDAGLLAASTAHHLVCRRAAGGLATLKPGRFAAVPALLALADAIAQACTIDAAFAGATARAREAA
jgi:aminoglycoside phosphotransferase (APT) family kinase protein